MKKVLYPGSFDPITYGHMDVIEKALKSYDKVIIGVIRNTNKTSCMFSIEERKSIIERIYEKNPNVEVISMNDNIASVDVALSNGCETMIRGLRNITNFAQEIEMASLNFTISDRRVDTVAFFADPSKQTISSSSVKEIFRLGKSITRFVHLIVEEAIKNKTGSDDYEN